MADPATPIERLVTPSLAQLGPERLAEVVRAYREELRTLAERHAYHACAWALEAIDTLVADNVRLQHAAERLSLELPVPPDADPVGVKEARKRGH
jgi:hypothetical protein